jgi:hypothetical protein
MLLGQKRLRVFAKLRFGDGDIHDILPDGAGGFGADGIAISRRIYRCAVCVQRAAAALIPWWCVGSSAISRRIFALSAPPAWIRVWFGSSMPGWRKKAKLWPLLACASPMAPLSNPLDRSDLS